MSCAEDAFCLCAAGLCEEPSSGHCVESACHRQQSGPVRPTRHRCSNLAGALSCDDMNLRASCRSGVSVAPSVVWQPAQCRRIESRGSRRFPFGSVPLYPCRASGRRLSMPTWTAGVVPHEGFSSAYFSVRRSGLLSTQWSSRDSGLTRRISP